MTENTRIISDEEYKEQVIYNGLTLLRKEFPDHQISKLPKPTKKQTDDLKANSSLGIRCKLCGGWHHKDVIHLDYVGHAALTDRLLNADLMWSWEPLAFDEQGLPRFDKSGGLWIKLTVQGMTRLGYGNAAPSDMKDIGSREKEVIGDALRNAAMRFGAALDLWHKGDLHKEEKEEEEPKSVTKITPDPVDGDKVFRAVVWFKEMIDADQIEENHQKIKEAWQRLSNNERMEVDAQLKDKAPDSNKLYKNLLKEYLSYVPSV